MSMSPIVLKIRAQRRPRENLQERIGDRGGHVGVLQLGPRIDAEYDVRPFARRAPPPFVHADQFDPRQHVDHRVVVPLDVAEDGIGVGKPQRLGGRGNVRLAGEQPVADPQRMVLVVVIVGRLGLPVLLGSGRLGRVELDVERVFVDVLRRTVEQGDAIVAGVGADVAADLADVAGQRRQQEDVAVLVVVVEELVRAHADREQRRARLAWRGRGPAIRPPRPAPRSVLRPSSGSKCAAYSLHQVEDRTAADFRAVGERHLDGAFQQRLDHRRLVADFIARERLCSTGRLVPPHKVAPLIAERGGDEHLLSAWRAAVPVRRGEVPALAFESVAGSPPNTSFARRYLSVSIRTRIGRSLQRCT